MISFDYANVEEDYFRDGGGDGEGVREGVSLGGERGIWWELVEWVVVGVESGWERRKLESGLGCISVRER